jgi:hypothetical protein
LGRTGTGAKAGVVSGVVYGAMSAVFAYISSSMIKEEMMTVIEETLPPDSLVTAEQLYEFTLIFGAVFAVVIGVVAGVILGVVYGWGYEKVPGGNSIYKGLVFGIILWIIIDVLLGLGNLEYGTTYFALSLAWGLVISLIFGALLGVFYDKFTPKEVS